MVELREQLCLPLDFLVELSALRIERDTLDGVIVPVEFVPATEPFARLLKGGLPGEVNVAETPFS